VINFLFKVFWKHFVASNSSCKLGLSIIVRLLSKLNVSTQFTRSPDIKCNQNAVIGSPVFICGGYNLYVAAGVCCKIIMQYRLYLPTLFIVSVWLLPLTDSFVQLVPAEAVRDSRVSKGRVAIASVVTGILLSN